MIIIEDTRNQIEKHSNIHKYCEENGISIVRSKLVVGDYTLPTNQQICIDTKQNMNEVYSNLTEYRRFHNEYVLAEKLGITLVILIEDSDIRSIYDVALWINPLEFRFQRGLIKQKPRPSTAIYKQMLTIQERHSVRWEFCSPTKTGETIIRILKEEPP